MMECISSSNIPCKLVGDRQPAATGHLSAGGRYVSVALDDGSLHVFSIVDGSHKLRISDPSGQTIWAHAVVDDVLIVGSMDGTLRASTIPDWVPTHQIPPSTDKAEVDDDGRHPEAIRRLHILQSDPATNTESVFAATANGSLHQWEIGSAGYRRSFCGVHDGTVFNVQSYDNGKRFVSAAPKGGTIAAWEVETGVMRWRNTQNSPVYSLAIVNMRAIVGRQDGGIRMLRLEDGAEVGALDAHSHVVNGLNVSGNYLISTAADGLAKVWSLLSSDSLLDLERSQRMYDLAVTSACMLDEWLVTAGKRAGKDQGICGLDMRLKVWSARNEHLGAFMEVGADVPRIWGLTRIGHSMSIAVSVMKRGVPALEIWKMR